MTVEEMVEWVREKGMDLGQLDILVEDLKCREANRINNRGIQWQVNYLMMNMHSRELKELVLHERMVLRSHHMAQQSKVVPEKNRKLRRGIAK